MKKINCKHGLDRKQEIEARRFRKRILECDETILKDRIMQLYVNWKEKPIHCRYNTPFYDYIKKNDVILCSSFERIEGRQTLYNYMRSIRLI